MSIALNADQFIKKLSSYSSSEELQKYNRYFKTGKGEYGEGDVFMGVRMGQVFATAKEFIELPWQEIEKLLESNIHEVRSGAMSIMAQQFNRKKTTAEHKKELFDLYLRRHDRINNWDLVDLAAYKVIGPYLADKPRDILYKLAKSKNMWERRTAIVCTAHFIRLNDLEDTFRIAELLMHDQEDLIHKATGWMLRFAGDKDHKKLTEFLDKYAATMPRTALRYALEHFNKDEKTHYMNLKKNT